MKPGPSAREAGSSGTLGLYALIFLLHAEFIGRVWNGVPLLLAPLILFSVEFIRKRTFFTVLHDLAFPLSLAFLFFLTRLLLRYFDSGNVDTGYILIFAQICFVSFCSYGVFATHSVTLAQAMRVFRNVIAISYVLSLCIMLMGKSAIDRFWELKLFCVDTDEFFKSNPGYVINPIGFALRQHSFSYQALMLAMASTVLIKKSKRPGFVDIVMLGVSFAALVTTRERSSFVAYVVFIVALIVWNISGKINIRKFAMLSLLALVLIAAAGQIQSRLSGMNLLTLFERLQNMDLGGDNRFQAAGYAALAPLSDPWGNGELAESYIDSARMIGFVNAGTGDVIGSHNHFSNTIMYVGFVGYFFVFAYFAFALLNIVNIGRKGRRGLDVLFLLFTGITLNSFAHNAGFFTAEVCTTFVLMAIIYQNKRGEGCAE
jgi:hypothetical protein